MTDLPLPDDAIAALFDADPATLDDASFEALISEFRRRRNVFASEEAANSLKAKKTRVVIDPTTKPTVLDKPTSEISLEDLEG